jgi:hypothetical protein
MTDLHTVEVTLCTDCLFDVGNECENRWCNTWQAQARIKSRQVIRNMLATGLKAAADAGYHQRMFTRQRSIRAGLKR